MTLLSQVKLGVDWQTVMTTVDEYLVGKDLAPDGGISPFVDTDGLKGVYIITTS